MKIVTDPGNRPPISLSHFRWDNVDENLWMQSSHILEKKSTACSEVLVWQLQGAQAGSAPLNFVACIPSLLRTASSPNFVLVQLTTAVKHKRYNVLPSVGHCSRKSQSLCKTIHTKGSENESKKSEACFLSNIWTLVSSFKVLFAISNQDSRFYLQYLTKIQGFICKQDSSFYLPYLIKIQGFICNI